MRYGIIMLVGLMLVWSCKHQQFRRDAKRYGAGVDTIPSSSAGDSGSFSDGSDIGDDGSSVSSGSSGSGSSGSDFSGDSGTFDGSDLSSGPPTGSGSGSDFDGSGSSGSSVSGSGSGSDHTGSSGSGSSGSSSSGSSGPGSSSSSSGSDFDGSSGSTGTGSSGDSGSFDGSSSSSGSGPGSSSSSSGSDFDGSSGSMSGDGSSGSSGSSLSGSGTGSSSGTGSGSSSGSSSGSGSGTGTGSSSGSGSGSTGPFPDVPPDVHVPLACDESNGVVVSRSGQCPEHHAVYTADDWSRNSAVGCCPLPARNIATGSVTVRNKECAENEIITGIENGETRNYYCTRINTSVYYLDDPKKPCYFGKGHAGRGSARSCANVPPALLPLVHYNYFGTDGCIGQDYGALITAIRGRECSKLTGKTLRFLSGARVEMFPE